MNTVLPQLKIDDLIVEKPIIQGGMGVAISLSGLASAVANEGGIGIISSVGIGFLNPDFKKHPKQVNKEALINEIRKARAKSSGLIGLNVMVAISDFDEHIKIGFDEGVDLIIMGAGLPLKLPAEVTPERMKSSKTKLAVIVSSGRAAQIIFRSWMKNYNTVPDMVIVEGPKAGGHLGFKREQIDHPEYALEKLVPDVVDAVQPYHISTGKDVPVIAAGGIFSGADIQHFLELGASGVQMATRFVATHECDASAAFKMSYLNSKKTDLKIIQSPVGLPGRALSNQFLNEVDSGVRKPFNCPYKCLKTCNFREAPYCIAKALFSAQQGIFDEGYAFAGANAYKVNEIISVKELFTQIQKEYSTAVSQMQLELA